ncbi:MAG: ATP-binding protein [Gammaproteobacteria bacterium]|nr:ATP-binding protein [Gammaproteobacteria bacterium]
MLDDFQVPSLGRVNLIVGRNNSGKSTVLEAIRILAARGNPRLLISVLTDHDETALLESDPTVLGEELVANGLKYLFPERRFPTFDDFAIRIGDTNSDLLKIEHLFFRTESEEVQDEEGELFENRLKRILISKADHNGLSADGVGQGLRISNGSNPAISRSTFIEFDSVRTRLRHALWDAGVLSEIPCSFIPTHFIPQTNLSDLWDRVSLTSFEDKVLGAMRLIEPKLRGMAFIKAPIALPSTNMRRTEARIPVVKLEGSDERIPLNSMGDGMLRVLQLVLAILPAQGGFLLIDEFENGLYYGVQEAVWKMVFELAAELDIQVFATTHSQDCIRSFAQASQKHPEEGVLFKLSQSRAASDEKRIIATVYSEEQLAFASETEMEVR